MFRPLRTATPLLVLSLVATLVGCADSGETGDGEGGRDARGLCLSESPLEREVGAAAREFAVPEQLLLAIGYVETRWWTPTELGIRHILEHGGVPDGVGILQVPLQRALARGAATELGFDEEELALDRRANVRAGAAFLRAIADSRAVRRDERDLAEWRDVLAEWGAGAESESGQRFADAVFRVLSEGAEVVSEEGRLLRIAPHPSLRFLDRLNDPLRTRDFAARPDYPLATWNPADSTNYSNRSRTASDISHVTIHVIQGSYSSAINWFQNPVADVSAHYVVSTEGDITQMVEEQDVAWHVGSENGYTVGIEHEGWVDNPAWFTDEMYRASAALTADICERNGIPLTRDYIMGHVEFPRQTHTDPGPYWDWDRYMGYVTGGTVDPTGSLVGFVRAFDIYDTTAPIAGATVTTDTGESATADSRGFYRIGGLPFASYTLTVSADGYVTATAEKSVSVSGDNWGSVALVALEDCDNAADDDRDGAADCDDPDCSGAGSCALRPENCDNGADDDGDGVADCDDADCDGFSACLPLVESCANGADDDGDGATDCDDLDCDLDPACTRSDEDCYNDADDDGDGATDCGDEDCAGLALCRPGAERCDGGVDEDGDGAIDCADADCGGEPACASGDEICTNSIDDDGDGDIDCTDADCLGDDRCGVLPERCTDGRDNDGDGDVDCADADCAATDACLAPEDTGVPDAGDAGTSSDARADAPRAPDAGADAPNADAADADPCDRAVPSSSEASSSAGCAVAAGGNDVSPPSWLALLASLLAATRAKRPGRSARDR